VDNLEVKKWTYFLGTMLDTNKITAEKVLEDGEALAAVKQSRGRNSTGGSSKQARKESTSTKASLGS
jgi:hypothetical protein